MKRLALTLLIAAFGLLGMSEHSLHAADSNYSVKLTQRAHHVIFEAPLRLPSMAIEVFSLGGERIFHGLSAGNGIIWDLRDRHGRKVPNGIYFYRMTSVDFAGQYHFGELRKFLVLR